ncbi:bifunctional 3,4-dihydroxy-2-butanone-4-phosphate synthase/GTP cyclohydrolase II [Thioalkalivibrio sp. XN8]|uniref:bifunctional 3,4-dihydroxy-2-butanone-4-phosphate synthase/GTP cyclohydrolase II n=1 Tax=Thioalkalivibrio sp. XN8 TaxID=2712863 RepID=UPI0023F0E75E|nr:bifunctional 3,4-dihydroxy-2-butanone-4-phosphate synthase/GTP cyclohydrolase II [Thioalkalivibrio sp. XN8]
MAKVSELKDEGLRLDPIDDVLADLRAGRMVVVMDDEDRENEGDLVMAAGKVRAEDINFMARYGRGLICLTLTPERCQQLRLPLMVTGTDRARSTNFTVSIEAAEGVTTGISAHDRAHTIQAAVAPDARPEDLRQPGHIFPLMGQPGGVLTRAGHTEAGCDLMRLAGLEPAAVIVEILNEDGTMARRPDLVHFARSHGLKMCTIAQLIRYRLEKEESVEQISEDRVETEYGAFRMVCFEDHVHQDVHLALVRGDIGPGAVPLVRVQLTDTLRDLVGVTSAQLGWPLRDAMRRIAQEEQGIVVLLRRHELPRELVDSVALLSGRPVAPADHRDGQESRVLRTYGIGAQILRALGVRKMRVLSAPKQMLGLSGFGLEVVDYVNH